MKIYRGIVIVAMLCIIPGVLMAQNEQEERILYVSPNGSDSNDGLATTTPLRTIQKAIDIADGLNNGDYAIFVAPGYYFENLTIDPYEHLIGGIDFEEEPEAFNPYDYIDEYFKPLFGDSDASLSYLVADPSLTAIQGRDYASEDTPTTYTNGILNFSIYGGTFGVLCTKKFLFYLKRCEIRESSIYGVAASESSPVLDECNISECGSDGVFIKDDPYVDPPLIANPAFIDTTIEKNGGSGITSYSSSWNNIVSGCTISENDYLGIYMVGSSPEISTTVIEKNTSDGIYATFYSNPEITESEILENGRNGIVVSDNSTLTIEDSLIDSNNGVGIFHSTLGDSTIKNNIISYNASYGIKVGSSITCECSGNEVIWNGDSGIQITDGSIGTLKENKIFFNKGSGLDVILNSEVTLEEWNAICANAGDGIFLQDYSQCTINGETTIFSNANNGIKIIDGAQASVEKSVIFCNANNGVFCSNSSDISLINNVLYRNSANGVFIEISATPILRNNIFAFNKHYGVMERYAYSDPNEVSYNCFYGNGKGNYLDENALVYNTADDINNLVQNYPGSVFANIVGDPLFVKWGNFSLSNPIYVDGFYTGDISDGTPTHPFKQIVWALASHSLHLSADSPCIGTGWLGKDIGAYPDGETPYYPEGSDKVKIWVGTATYNEANLVVADGVYLDATGAEVVGDEGVTVFHLQGDAQLNGFDINTAEIGVYCEQNSNGFIANCNIDTTYLAGVYLFKSFAGLYFNDISDNQDYGIRAYGGAPLILANLVSSNGSYGIFFRNESNPVIVGNTIQNNILSGIKFMDDCIPTISHNEVSENRECGIYMDSNCAPLIESNVIERNEQDGISVNYDSAPTIVENTVKDNLKNGIYVNENSHSVIEANFITNNNWDGITCQYDSTSTISNNLIWSNRDDAISLLFDSDSTVVNNTIYDNYNNGVLIRKSAPSLRNNLFLANYVGVNEYDANSDPSAFTNNYLDDQGLCDYYDEFVERYSFPEDDLNVVVNNNGGEVSDNIYGNAGLIDSTNADFHLDSSSVCIDAGGFISGLAQDFEGDPRGYDGTAEPRGDGSDFDIGADEYYPVRVANYTFQSGDENWDFVGQIPPYDEPLSSALIDLGLSPGGSTYAFSYWSSPQLQIQDGKLYRARWLVQSTATDPDLTVQFRLRINQQGSWQSWERGVNSFNQQAPSIGNSKWYDVFFNPVVTGSGDDEVVASFDIMSFDPNDDTYSWLYLDQMTVDEASVTPGAQVISYDFTGGTQGWGYAGQIPPYDEPTSSSTGGQLGLSPNGSVNCFSFWVSPNVTIQQGKAYQAQFTMKSSVADPDSAVQFRLRINQLGSWQAWARGVNSFNQQAPSNTQPKSYEVIFNPDVTGAGDNLVNLSFDIMSFDPADDVNSWLYLDSATLQEVTINP
ncbi:right-handed parallel beta-helix repeat-containing protein [Candidatus Sumerlaeota bacterium]|nr:right-handed parallel beta-helix repeat-containing protein [Candidatus Sumerlaeota bacterium]